MQHPTVPNSPSKPDPNLATYFGMGRWDKPHSQPSTGSPQKRPRLDDASELTAHDSPIQQMQDVSQLKEEKEQMKEKMNRMQTDMQVLQAAHTKLEIECQCLKLRNTAMQQTDQAIQTEETENAVIEQLRGDKKRLEDKVTELTAKQVAESAYTQLESGHLKIEQIAQIQETKPEPSTCTAPIDIEQLRTAAKWIEQVKDKLQPEYRQLKQQDPMIERLKAEIVRLQWQVHHLQAAKTEVGEPDKQLETKCKSLEESLAEAKTESSKMQQKMRQLNSGLGQKYKECKSKAETREAELKTKLRKAQERISELKTENFKLKSAQDQRKKVAQIKIEPSREKQLLEQIQTLKKENEEQQEFAQKRENMLEQEIRDAHTLNETLQQQMYDLQGQLNDAKSDLANRTEHLRAKLKRAESATRPKGIEGDSQDLVQAEITTRKDDTDGELQKRHYKLKRMYSTLETKVKDLEAQLTTSGQTLAMVSKQREKVVCENLRMITEHKSKVMELEAQINDAKRQDPAEQKQLQLMEANLSQSRAQLAATQDQNSKLSERYEALRNERCLLFDLHQALQADFSQTATKLAELENEKNHKLAELQSEKVKLSKELQLAKQEPAPNEEFEKKLRQLDSQLCTALAALMEMEKFFEKLRKEIGEKAKNEDDLKRELFKKERENLRLTKRCHKLREKSQGKGSSKNKEKVTTENFSQTEVTDADSTIKALEEKLRNSEIQLTGLIESKDQALAEAKNQLAKAQEQLVEIQSVFGPAE